MSLLISRQKSRLMIIASAVLLLVGCQDRHGGIVGQWRAAGDANALVWDFSKDGSVLMGRIRGRYSLGNQQRLKIETPFATSVYQMELSAERMILREPNGSKLEFTRLR
jgi:hypothetical protein